MSESKQVNSVVETVYDVVEKITSKIQFELINEINFNELVYIDTFDVVYRGNHDIFNDIIKPLQNSSVNLYREHENILHVISKTCLVRLKKRTSSNISSLTAKVYSSNTDDLKFYEKFIKDNISVEIINSKIFGLDWYFSTASGIQNTYVQDVCVETLIDCAYPEIPEGIDAFVNSYLNSNEPVLILQGPPGTGKTRLIKYILSSISKKLEKVSKSIYTGDENVFESESLFIDFITENVDALIIEDADYLLESRKDGNKIMHNFLKGSDGLISAQKKKIIFSVNLPGLNNVDEALLRPGRCFRAINMRNLEAHESQKVIDQLTHERNQTSIVLNDEKYSLAELYKMVK